MRIAIVLILLSAQMSCTLEPDSGDMFRCAPELFEDGAVLVLTTNYETSSVDLFHPDCPDEIRQNRVIASGDAVLKKWGKLPVVVNRGAESNLMVLNERLDVVSQISLPGCGPHDIVGLDEDNLLVSCYESTSIQKVVLSEERSEVWLELADYSGSDGFPEMDALAIDENYVYVTLQNLDRRNNWTPEKPGTVLVFERDGLALYQEIILPCDNPFTGLFFRDSATMWVGCAGDWGDSYEDAGIISLNLNDWSVTTLYDGADLNGRPTALDTGVSSQSLAVSAMPSSNSAWDVATMQVLRLEQERVEALYTQSGFSLGGIKSWADDKLLIAQRTYDSQSGVLLLDLATMEVERRWQTGLLPSHFIVSD